MTTYFITRYDPVRFLTTARLSNDNGTYLDVVITDSELCSALSPTELYKVTLDRMAHEWTQSTSEACRTAKHYDGSWIITSLPLAQELDEYWEDVEKTKRRARGNS